MTILSKLTATAAAIALAGAVMAPLAAADNRSEKRAERSVDRGDRAERRQNRNANRGERRTQPRAERNTRAERPNRAERPRTQTPRADNGNRGNRGQTRNIRAEDRVNRGERQLYANNSVRGQHDRPARVQNRQNNRADRRSDRRQANRTENRQIRNNAYNRGQRDANRNNRTYNRAQQVNRNYNNNRRYSYHTPRRSHVRRAPRVVYNYRNFYHTPRYSYISYNHYNDYYRSYTPRYQIGGFYGYHNNSIIIQDYAYYGLYDPPYGHHWVHDHDSGDAILASVATGAIVGLIIGILAN